MHQGSLRYSESDQQYVTSCLGRTPQGVVGVAARRPTGEPAVIINLPLLPHVETWQPFPTLYWLVDPNLTKAISDIERKGGVRKIQQIIADDPALEAEHREDNAFYAKARWAVLNDKEKQAAKELGMDHMLEQSGIGGVANHDGIKCLHAQYAFHLARQGGSTVGKLMQERYGL
ncbi:MAG: DUF501 domain-containing protein [Phycisphaeraceae bacterium]